MKQSDYFLAKPADNLKPARFTDVITGASTCEFVGFFLPPAPSPSGLTAGVFVPFREV